MRGGEGGGDEYFAIHKQGHHSESIYKLLASVASRNISNSAQKRLLQENKGLVLSEECTSQLLIYFCNCN